MRKTLLLISLTLTSSFLVAQSFSPESEPTWVEMMQDPQANFFETQQAFYDYWEGKERTKGDGFKVFKRWEWYWSQRINADGSFPDPDKTIDTYTDWRIAYNQAMQGAESITGDWSEVGPRPKPTNGTGQPNGNGRLNCIAFHPTDPNQLYVGAPAGGFWMTTNGGQSWETTTDDLPTLGVSSIVIDSTDTDIIYIGTGDRDAGDSPGLGVYKSTDGGQSWVSSNSGMGNKTVGQMLIHPDNSAYLLAATSGGIYRSTNSGGSWTLENANGNFKDMKFKPGDPDIVYATETSGGAGFWRSTDGGDNWTEITTGLPSTAQRYAIAVTPADPDVVYLLRSISSAYGGLYRSDDSGLNFNTQSTTPNILQWSEDPPASGGGGQGWYDLAVAADPTDEDVVYVGGVNIFKSVDAGVTWDCAAHWVGSATAASVHADHHWLEYSPVNGNLYNCNDGGLYYTADNGTTWPEISDSLGISQIYKIGVSANTNPLVINGYQDNGTAIWDQADFRTERGGDGMECLIDPTNDDIIYATVYYGNIARSFNNGYSFGSFAANNVNGITESGAWVTPFIVDPATPQTMYIGYKNVWRTTDAYSPNPTFTAISNNLAGSNSQNMRVLRLSKVNHNRLFAVRGDNRLFRTDNATATTPSWTDLTGNLPSGSHIPDIETSPTNNNVLWMIRSNAVYKSFNGGSSWSNITANLPNITKNCLVADPLSAGGLYIGTDAGVYYIDDNLSNWIAFDDGLPANAEVTELEIFHPNGNWEASRIRAGTYGRGLWESDLYNPETIAPLAFIAMSIDSTDVCSSDTILLYNNSAYGIDSTHWNIAPASGVTFVNGTTDTSQIAQIVVDQVGTYSVTLYVQNANGSDSVVVPNAIIMSGGLTPPFLEDFENTSPCQSGGCNTSCLVTDWTNIENGVGDDIDWRADNFGTPWSVSNYSSGGNTGPSIDFDPGTAAGHYLYVSSYPPYTSCYNQIAELESPCISLENVTLPSLSFAYHMFGNGGSFNDLEVEVFSNGSWTSLTNISGNNYGDQWNTTTTSLNAYVGEHIKLKFIGESGSGWQSDMAIDGVGITASPQADFIATDSTPCVGQTVTLNDLSSQAPNAWNWTITPASFSYIGGSSANSQNPLIQFNADGVYTVTLQATNVYGTHSVTKTGYIIVDSPDPLLTSNATNNTFCPEDTAFIAANADMDHYQFFENNTLFQQGNSNTTAIYPVEDGSIIKVIVTDSSGCEAEQSITLSLYDSPTSTLTCSDEDNVICDGDTVTFTNTTNNALVVHDFYQNSLLVQSDSINQWMTSTIIDGDSISVQISDTNGCAGTSNAINMQVLPLPPTPSIMLLLDSLECSPAADMYKWRFEDSNSVSAYGRYPKQGDGTYAVRILQGGCWSLWSEPFIITGFTGLGDFGMKVYPSPATSELNIELLHLPGPTKGNLSIYDMQGKQVYRKDALSLNSSELLTIDIESLATGVYSVVLEMEQKKLALTFVKELR